MKPALVAAALGLALFVAAHGAALAIVLDHGLPEQACDAPAAAASREHVKRERGGIGNPDVCTFVIATGKDRR